MTELSKIFKPEESVGLGLAAFREPDGLNLFRPPFDINLEWISRSGDKRVINLYPAFEPISTANLMQDNHFNHSVNIPREQLPEVVDGYIVIRTPSGLLVKIKTETPELVDPEGKLVKKSETLVLNSLEVKLGASDFRFVFYASGGIVIHDCIGREHSLKITEWPAIRSNRKYANGGPTITAQASFDANSLDGKVGSSRIIPSFGYPHF